MRRLGLIRGAPQRAWVDGVELGLRTEAGFERKFLPLVFLSACVPITRFERGCFMLFP